MHRLTISLEFHFCRMFCLITLYGIVILIPHAVKAQETTDMDIDQRVDTPQTPQFSVEAPPPSTPTEIPPAEPVPAQIPIVQEQQPQPEPPPPPPTPVAPVPEETPIQMPSEQARVEGAASLGAKSRLTTQESFASQQVLDDTQMGGRLMDGYDMEAWKLRYRRFNSWEGSTGGIHLVDPRSGAPGSVRIQLGINGFGAKDYLSDGDDVEQISQTLAVGWTALEYLEVYGAIFNNTTVVNELNSDADDDAIPENYFHSQGNALLGVKSGASVSPAIALGGDLSVILPNQSGSIGIKGSGIGVRLRGDATADLRGLDEPVPFIARLNLDYLFDHSETIVEDRENYRYSKLEDPKPKSQEAAHLITREERLGLGINRVDFFSIGLGIETPLEVAEEFILSPALEWRVSIPVNRRGFKCPLVKTDSDEDEEFRGDSCMSEEGIDAIPMSLTLGIRGVTPIRGIALLLGLDVGLSGTSTFVRELAPTPPFQILFALSYDYDARPTPSQEATRKPVEVATNLKKGESATSK